MKNIILLFSLTANIVFSQKKTQEEASRQYLEMILQEQIHFEPDDDDDTFYYFPFYTSGIQEDILFKNIYQNSKKYWPCYCQLISSDTLNQRYKHYAILAMQGLPFQQYLKVIQCTYNSYKVGLVNIRTLHQGIYQYEWSKTVANNINNPKLKILLHEILLDKSIPERLKQNIRQMQKKKR